MSIWTNMKLQPPTLVISNVDFNLCLFYYVTIWYSFHIIWSICKTWLSYHSTLINLQTRQTTFTMFIGIVGSCWLGVKGNFNKFSFANTYIDSTFSISLENSKFIKNYKEKLSQWSDYWTKKCTNLTWYESRDLIIVKKCWRA